MLDWRRHPRPPDPVPTFAPSATDTETHCPYCAFQCGIRLGTADGEVTVSGNQAFPVNKGALCIKGFTSSETLRHPDRLRTPLIRSADGTLASATWDEALDRIAAGIRAVQEDRKSTRLNSSHSSISYAVFCL